MTANQIKAVLADLGYSTDQLIPLTEVTAIVLEGNYNIYPDETCRINFCTKNGLSIILYYNGSLNDAGEFVANEKPRYVVAFDQILAFMLKTPTRQKSPYKVGMSI